MRRTLLTSLVAFICVISIAPRALSQEAAEPPNAPSPNYKLLEAILAGNEQALSEIPGYRAKIQFTESITGKQDVPIQVLRQQQESLGSGQLDASQAEKLKSANTTTREVSGEYEIIQSGKNRYTHVTQTRITDQGDSFTDNRRYVTNGDYVASWEPPIVFASIYDHDKENLNAKIFYRRALAERDLLGYAYGDFDPRGDTMSLRENVSQYSSINGGSWEVAEIQDGRGDLLYKLTGRFDLMKQQGRVYLLTYVINGSKGFTVESYRSEVNGLLNHEHTTKVRKHPDGHWVPESASMRFWYGTELASETYDPADPSYVLSYEVKSLEFDPQIDPKTFDLGNLGLPIGERVMRISADGKETMLRYVEGGKLLPEELYQNVDEEAKRNSNEDAKSVESRNTSTYSSRTPLVVTTTIVLSLVAWLTIYLRNRKRSLKNVGAQS